MFLCRAGDIYGSTFVEIIGTVNPDRCKRVWCTRRVHPPLPHSRACRTITESSHTAFKENFDLAQVRCVCPRPCALLDHACPCLQYNEAVLMANGKFKALFAQ